MKMNIEVSENLFKEIFDNLNCENGNEITEAFEKVHYHNLRLNVFGFKMWNFASSKKWQYYLTDINC